ncbi:MAG: phenylalanine--tRNA ligase subunit alpha, partial [Proteobacteria bacterium]|nr:phenylalanine--tRNA ligase subunit alpha [Pseudomonadota bacterium]
MHDELLRLKAVAGEELSAITQIGELEPFRVKYLGRKGEFTLVMRQLGQAPPEERPRLGQLANEIKQNLETAFAAQESRLAESAGGAAHATLDLTLPGRTAPFGKLHPVTQVMDAVCSIFEGLGFAVAEGPDVEVDFYNFEALNIPPHHPARAMHDTFYVSDSLLL